MDEARWLDEDEQAAWRHLVAVLLRLPSAIEQQLQREAGLTHVEYLVLVLLSEAGDSRLRLSHLAGEANTSLSRLSHVVTRMERRGWLVRERDPEDRRATRAALTDAGHAEVVAAAPGHVALVRRLVFDGLPPAEVAALGRRCEAILERIDPARGPIGPPPAHPADETGTAPAEATGARPQVHGDSNDHPPSARS